MRAIAGVLLLGLAGCSEHPQDAVPSPTVSQVPAKSPQPAPPPAPAPPETPATRVVLDVMQVVGKSESEVSGLLGQPLSCQDIHRARLCRYAPDEGEVMFVAGKADMITVQGMDAFAFDEDALAALGLAPAKSDQWDEYAIRWGSIPGLEEVSVFPGKDARVDYAYVKVGKH